MTFARYARLFAVQLRTSVVVAMQYRSDFLIEGVISFFWLAANLIPLFILYHQRTTVAGWDFPSALVVIGFFTMLRGALEGAINPSLVDIVDRVRTGTFDFVLLKPCDAQFLVSTARFAPWKLIDVFGGLALVSYALHRLGRTPDVAHLAVAAVLFAGALFILYSLWILVISASFFVIRLDNLAYFFSALFDAARWPIQVFRGLFRLLFTFIIPLALMTTYPAMALLGRLSARTAVACILGALIFAALARMVWNSAIANYTSASS
jgi:ABC-2 type transport system permease protein